MSAQGVALHPSHLARLQEATLPRAPIAFPPSLGLGHGHHLANAALRPVLACPCRDDDGRGESVYPPLDVLLQVLDDIVVAEHAIPLDIWQRLPLVRAELVDESRQRWG